ncbi:MAG: mevalonate kinase [Thermoprotei archaeon]|nr:MAG: mevalonate kinase [Thermoprotei archaeon]
MHVITSAPGKVTLFGEHAVVYGEPALVTSIDKRVYVRLRLRDDKAIKISAQDLHIPGLIVTLREEEVILETDYGKVIPAISYIKKAIELTADYVGKFRGVDIEVTSDMPVGAGLGTSAAVAIATIYAYLQALKEELSKEEIARLGWRVEKEVQGMASPMDTSIATFGGFLYIKYRGSEVTLRRLKINTQLPLVIGYVEREFKTADMVKKVKVLYDKYPGIVKDIFSTIGRITEEALRALEVSDVIRLGELMNINQGLLDAIGVSNSKLSTLVYVARAAGALGAKLTGAGGGGCVIALAPGRSREVAVAMRLAGARTIDTSIGGEGVRVEKVINA